MVRLAFILLSSETGTSIGFLGILPHDGRNITFRQLNTTIRSTYNFAPTFCYFVPNHIAGVLDRNYWSDSFDLSDIDVHNGIEHDASLTREYS